ncbi:histidine phosphatase family protein [Aestuariirhabdus sp. Z084]|uniref:histidine phosphatase family protein n=1 Tax=Aestuariirhabdus haliotis TaxID=2918751 RepID=UPI00201B4545|nr:histidine phosphatase family protein [Aestuariirhabdus haliotis]MCL6414838.1 histidine phosphatase family protein [Aestuariirhabdus haliotis]MCL6418770.1 histidine phosphatase family protein [Aestuariirhabdus haliotis]
MIRIYMLRHGTTPWNVQKRIQGHTDIALLPQAFDLLCNTPVANRYKELTWFSSPLLRAVETAKALGLNAVTEPALIEMEWGEWEGQTLAELRAMQPEVMSREEAKGLFMTPPQGENPSQVITRLMAWLSELAPQSDIGLVTHKGVIRAAIAQACGWNMLDKCPIKPDWNKALEFTWSEAEGLGFGRVDCPLD